MRKVKKNISLQSFMCYVFGCRVGFSPSKRINGKLEASHEERQSIVQKNKTVGRIMGVKAIEYIKDYKLKLVFSDKTVKTADLENLIMKSSGIFLPLRDLDYFKQVALDDCQLSICWPNGADICPDVLYEMGKNVKKVTAKGAIKRNRVHTTSKKPQTRVDSKS